ncbi:substrate-binding domain-containing protein [Microbacterium sp. X-17]|uniref:substrate-binding domain-containing protein n=1 Tax=Microbacterium sp. X-17 TaxID=3144404 RepID=UPI0031F565CA
MPLAFASTDSARSVFERTDFGVPVLIASEAEDLEPGEHLDEPGMGAVVSHLVPLGHKRLLHIAGPATWSAARNRQRVFAAAVARHGLHPAGILHGDWSARSGHDAVVSLSADSLPTAIVAANDQMALGAIHALVARGLKVPDDISVTGVDDTPEAPYFTPSLTTIRLDFRPQGRDAVASLLAQLEQTDGTRPTRPEPQLIVRESTAVPSRA